MQVCSKASRDEYIYLCAGCVVFTGQEFFQVAEYEKELEEMKTMTRQEFVASLRR